MARPTSEARRPPATPCSLARRRGCGLATGAALALLVWGSASALAADAAVALMDTVGDVTVDPSGPQWRAPDIIRAGLAYEGGADETSADDLVRGTMDVDGSTDPGTQTRIYSGRIVSWWIDTDNNPATGATRGDLGRGADALVVVFGSAAGVPTKGWVKFAQNGQFPRDGREIPVSVGDGGVQWTQSPAQLGIQRGRPVRVWFETAYTDGTGRTLASDVAPDDKSARVLVPPFPPPAAAAGAGATGPSSATVSGTIDGRGAPSTWYVLWGPAGGPQTATQEVGDDGSAPHPFQVPLDGLSPSTQYTYQVVVANPWGETRTPPVAFALPAPAPVTAPGPVPSASVSSTPVVQAAPPGPATGQSLTMTGTFAPSGTVNRWFFEWGTSPALGRATATRTVANGGLVSVRARLSGLRPGTTYHYRLVGIVDGVRTEGPVQRVSTARVGKLVLAGRVRMVCRAGVCTISRRTALTVRVSDPAGRAVTGRRALRGLRAGVRCLKVCRGTRRVTARMARGRVTLALPPAVQSWRLRRGAVVELRVTRAGGTGVAYRVRTLGARAQGTMCRVELSGVPRCPLVRRTR